MFKDITIKNYFISILSVLGIGYLVLVALLCDGFDTIEISESELVRQQKSVILIKDVRFHVVQIQQFLTDVSATHRQAGFQEAASQLHAAYEKLDELGSIKPSLQDLWRQLQQEITLTHDNGVKMAWDYIKLGIDVDNVAMNQLDVGSAKLSDHLNRLAIQLDQELRQGVAANEEIIHSNRLLLIWSAPIVIIFFGWFIDKISQQLKQKMNSLTQRTTQLNTILDTVPSAIITIDKTGAVQSFNCAAERIFGYSLSEIIGCNVSLLMPAAVAAEHDGLSAPFFDTPQANILGKLRDVEAQRKNGEIFPALLRVNPMEIDGELFFCGVIEDNSETKMLLAQLGQAQKLEAVGQLASGVAHEINTPIQYIGDNLSALHDNFKDILAFQQNLSTLGDDAFQARLKDLAENHDLPFILEDSPNAIKQAQEGVERVAEIVKVMKTFSHIESSHNKQIINLHDALNSTLTISRNSYKYIAEIETDFAGDVGCIECYAGELNQVFLNMIINATHAIEEKHTGKGLIKIITRKLDDNHVEILFADNGAGIPADLQEKVFNLFFTTKAVGKGTGQGLSLAHNIVVEKHLGKLFFESSVGVGTTFHIQLPITLDQQA